MCFYQPVIAGSVCAAATAAFNLADLVVGQALHDEVQADHQADEAEYGDDANGHGGGGNLCQRNKGYGEEILERYDDIGKNNAQTNETDKYDYTKHNADDAHDFSPHMLI